MRFLIDMPLSPDLIPFLDKEGHDAVHALGLGLDRAPDDQILQRAKEENRTIITADLDFPRLLALLQAKAPGVILFRHGNVTEEECEEKLKKLFQRIDPVELNSSIIVIEEHRVRKRRLPIKPSTK